MKIIRVSEHIFKIEAWFLVKMSAWIIKEDQHVYIIDTGVAFMGERIVKEAQKMGEIKEILLTHGHSDHVGGLKKILNNHSVPVFAHKQEIPYMEGEQPYPGRKKEEVLVAPGIAKPLMESDSGELEPIGDLVPIHTPGHTPGHVSYYHKKDQVLIAGDLFTSKKRILQKPMAMFTSDMKQAVQSAYCVKELKPKIISICHGNDVANPKKQIDAYLKRKG
ncbi:MBL fold metallo-hydrolase [Jeotgalibacillus soli]|uniref:beta-lactamase n=1 Tax=Jeotgalibacillus soli TaxID=889306 RepID=A0A0C2W7C1_9BACL|nr:MBL fold metallo-hydrolase [Jeotgalibacillus soli]KIL51938.1 hypothetical protein KP78_03080 [Jeotgalibacillus soli]